MDVTSQKKYVPVLITLILIGVSFFSGQYVGEQNAAREFSLTTVNTIEQANKPSLVRVDFSPFWRAWEAIDQKFIPSSTSTASTNIDQDRVWGAIEGMVAALGDPYTVFFPPAESTVFESDINGNFGGVGMEVGVKDDILTVVAPLKGTPAERAGVRAGDLILKIDDTPTGKLSVDEAVRMIRGDVGTKVRITFARDKGQEPFEIVLTRAVIDIPTIETEIRADGIFVIRLFNFSAVSPNLFRDALRKFVSSGSDKLILDLRGNPGGYLEASVSMASWFLPPGAVVVKEDYKKNSDTIVHRSRGYDIFNDNLSMVILIDGGTASASEILAGALREHNIATLIGTNSFGKGSVQELVKITPDTSLKVTIAQWVTPNGVSISAGGLKPDIEVKPAEKNPSRTNDPQMAKAVEFLLGK